MADRLYVVGMMGAGKSVVGEALAELLGWGHLDTDAVIERDTAMTVSEVFSVEGESLFRRRESAVIADAAAEDRPLVVSTGGGAVLDVGNRTVLTTTGAVVWLRARVETLAERVGDTETRPLLVDAPDGDVLSVLARIDAERGPLYALVADIVVDVDDLDVEGVTRHILTERDRRAGLGR